MKIISLVSYPFLPAKTGGQKGIALFYKYFCRYQDVTIVTVKKNNPATPEGYELLNVLGNSKLRYINPFIFFRMRRLIRQNNATHVMLEHPYFGWLGFLLKQFCHIKLVVHSHNIEGNRWKSLGKWWWSILWRYERFTHRQADANFFIQDDDRQYAIRFFGLDPKKCITVSFGTERSHPPEIEKHISAATTIRNQTGFASDTSILLMNGAFQYHPNRVALENLVYKINPLLQKQGLNYRILLLGIDIPQFIMQTSFPNIQVIGFAEDLDLYLNGADIFLNPVITGGGIKTKLVEALAFNLTSVSTTNGAMGIDPEICNEKLFVCPDNDWNAFANAILRAIKIKNNTPPEFYENFYWGNITKNASDFLLSRK